MNIKPLTLSLLLLLTGCASQEKETTKKKPLLSNKEAEQLLTKADQQIEEHHYNDAKESFQKIINEVKDKKIKEQAKQLEKSLEKYTDVYQLTLSANDEKEYEKAGQELVTLIKENKDNIIAKEATDTLIKFEQATGLNPEKIMLDTQNYVLFDKYNKTTVYKKADLSGKKTKIDKNTLAIAEDMTFAKGKKCYKIYRPATDKEKQKFLGYVAENEITLLKEKTLNKPGKAIKDGESKMSMTNNKKHTKIKKGYCYYITSEINYDHQNYYVLNKINDDKKPNKKNNKYIYRGVVKTDMIQLD